MLRGYYIHKFAVCKGLLKKNSIIVKTELNPARKQPAVPRKKGHHAERSGVSLYKKE
jgi:hypothetical protein